MWSQFSHSLKTELEYLFSVMAEAALPDQLWLPAQKTLANGVPAPDTLQH